MANAQYVSTGKPLVGGAIYRAPFGTSLPDDALEELNAAFKSLGYVSEDGLSNANTKSSKEHKDWSGATVMTTLEEKTDNFKFKLIESLNVEVLKTVFGDANVSGDLATGITIKANASEDDLSSYVVDMISTGGYVRRVVIPCAKISEVAEIVYKKDEVVGYDCTLSALLDSDDNSHYEYIQKPTSPTPDPEDQEED